MLLKAYLPRYFHPLKSYLIHLQSFPVIYMRQLTLLIGLILAPFYGLAQTYEFGGFLGGANYIGDVGDTKYISPNQLVVGGLFKWNRSPRHSFRASATIGKITANDLDANDQRRVTREYQFKNTIKEFSLGIEFTFWEYNPHPGTPIQTPYLYIGLTYFIYDDLYRDAENNMVADGKGSTFAIPMVLGYKTTLTRFISLGFEIGARYTFTDNLDGSNPSGAGDMHYTFGNLNSNDWYVFSGITLTFAFGRAPCNSKF